MSALIRDAEAQLAGAVAALVVSARYSRDRMREEAEHFSLPLSPQMLTRQADSLQAAIDAVDAAEQARRDAVDAVIRGDA